MSKLTPLATASALSLSLTLGLATLAPTTAHADDVRSTVDMLIDKCWGGLRLTPQVVPQKGIRLLGQSGAALFTIANADVPAFQQKLSKDLDDLGNVVGPDKAGVIRACMAGYEEAADQALAASAPPPAPVAVAPAPVSLAPAPIPLAAMPAPAMGFVDPEPGAIGRLVNNASLINGATWGPEPSRVNRLLHFDFHVEARAGSEDQGLLNVTLAREGRDVCTISLNSKTSPNHQGVRWGNATCTDTLPAQGNVQYQTRVQATDMLPIKVVLERVDAVRK
jgi:hypothetical protein